MVDEQTVSILIKRLADIPARIQRATINDTKKSRQATLAQDAWSAAEILAHLRAADDILSQRLHAVLVRDNPLFLAYDERRWAEIAKYLQADFSISRQCFSLRRAELVRMVQHLTLAEWQRIGTHEVHGPMTLFELASQLVEHETEHCLQLEAA